MIFEIGRKLAELEELLIDRLNQKDSERLFRRLIDIEFLSELDAAQRLSKIPVNQRSPGMNYVNDYLMEKYVLNQKCASPLYDKVSKELRREYNVIHRKIMILLT